MWLPLGRVFWGLPGDWVGTHNPHQESVIITEITGFHEIRVLYRGSEGLEVPRNQGGHTKILWRPLFSEPLNPSSHKFSPNHTVNHI